MFKQLRKKVYNILSVENKEKAIKLFSIYKKIVWTPRNIYVFSVRPFIKNRIITDINFFEQKIYSQNGEDGIINIIFKKIGVTNKYCVEFGVEDGQECNTRLLLKRGWRGLQMDGADDTKKPIRKEFITAENINTLFKKYRVPREFDLLSIDIDSNDYWIWKAIKGYNPRLVIMEYNASIPSSQSKTVKYDARLCWDGTNYMGASLLALAKLGKKKGYSLIGCDNMGINAFFVREDLIKDNFIVHSVKKTYKPPQYGEIIDGKYTGHPKSKQKMIRV